MYIREITLNGFKSYGQPRTLENMDQHFNAITGLNGSGKSNILDAICFVLGQNAPTDFRVANMQELVYKKGAGGITSASVEIVFDNTDRKHKPASYADCDIIRVERRIPLQGKGKFTINGSTCTQTQVLDFFKSVQLNIHNPHFLIMQGRITKVLNMKPEGIWKMVEEAAGTMFYVSKRDATTKTLEMKQKSVAEVGVVDRDLIKPQIDRLQAERKNVIELQKLTREFEAEERLLLAVDAYEQKLSAAEKTQERQALKSAEQNAKADLEVLNVQLAESKERIAQMEAESQGGTGGPSLKTLEEEYENCHKMLGAKKAKMDTNERLIVEENKRIAVQNDDIQKEHVKIAAQNRVLEGIMAEVATAEAKKVDLANKLERAQQALAVVITGVGGEGNEDLSWKNQCNAAEVELGDIERQINRNNQTLKLSRTNLAKVLEKVNLNSANKNVLRDVENAQRTLDALQTGEPAFSEADDARLALLEDQNRALSGQKAAAEQARNRFRQENRYLELEYQKPDPNFDDRKVYGSVAKFLNVKEPNRFLAAIDSAAGGKKFNFVVEDDITSKALLNRGDIRRRVTILPLNRIKAGRVISEGDMAKIEQKIGRDKAWAAIDLVTIEPRMDTVVKYAVGGYVVCADLQTANDIAFDSRLGFHCVTLDGDSVNPDGIVSGGIRTAAKDLILTKVNAMRQLIDELADISGQIEQIQTEMADLTKRRTDHRKWTTALRDQKAELAMLQSKCDSNDALRNAREADRLKEEIKKLEEDLRSDTQKKDELTARIKDLKKKLSSEDAAEIEKAEATKTQKDCEAAVNRHEQAFDAIRKKEQTCRSAISAAQDTIGAINEEIVRMRVHIRDLEMDIEREKIELEPYQAAHNVAKEKRDRLRQSIAEKNEGLSEAKAADRALGKAVNKATKDLEKIVEESAKAKGDLKTIETYLNELFKEHPWVGEEYDKLGTDECAYKVEGLQSATIQENVNKLKKKREQCKLSAGSEMNADYDLIVKRHEDVGKRQGEIRGVKVQMEQSIDELDIRKQTLIERAVDVVNEHFGNIFGTLLNGAHCKLERETNDHGEKTEALRIRVGFGKKKDQTVLWKESLSELSGGQRSLVALSLVLAMLRMNPAPIYVLDEIDAALDLNHTQNVGKMIRKYFSQSQFIIVSLKEGMFTNANCIYRITFPGGLSAITRTAKEKTNRNDEMEVSEED